MSDHIETLWIEGLVTNLSHQMETGIVMLLYKQRFFQLSVFYSFDDFRLRRYLSGVQDFLLSEAVLIDAKIGFKVSLMIPSNKT